MTGNEPQPPPLQGIHHLKLPVSDLDTSLTFYERAFGGRRIPEAGEAVNHLLQPAARQELSSGMIARVSDAIAAGLHNVYILCGAVAIVCLVLALLLPPRLSPTRPAAGGRSE